MICFLSSLYPIWTAKMVSRDTGIPAPTVTKWLARGSAPSAGHLATLARTYRLAFLAAVYVEVTELEVAHINERIAARESEIDALRAEIAEVRS